MENGKTSTFTIHHDRCKPAEWVPSDIITFANFVRTGDMRYAGHLSRLGVQLVLSEHHEPKGGTIQEIGWATPTLPVELVSDDMEEIVGDEDVAPVTRIYRGPVEYAARMAMGDGDGHFEGYDYTFYPTQAEADAFIDSIQE